ncbi:riboflavin biosynthesis protein RibF [Candidatus Saganbacteria bacterium]|nr:riboflavin biosynthesis protein RibF [Candidatus Saganbacteria bacterium]
MQGSVVALGTFDGVHLGHQRIIKDALNYSKRKGLRCVVTTFDPHPQQFIAPERGLKLLTTLEERRYLFKSFGIPNISVLKFNEKLYKLNYKDFAEKYLVEKLNAAIIFVGYDHAFGHGRRGGIKELRALGREYGFQVKMVKPFKSHGHIVKSSIIRKFIAEGKFNKAIHFLGHSYPLTGKVVRGEGIGAGLGYPTANLKIGFHKLIPAPGVYIGRVHGKRALISIGTRPTFGGGHVVVEVHIPQFHKNLYGLPLRVEIKRQLRRQIKFTNAIHLKKQIAKDVAKCLRSVI